MKPVFRFREILSRVAFPGYAFEVRRGHGGIFLRARHTAYDVVAGVERPQMTRKWLLSPFATDSEVVQTAFKCIITSKEHEAREFFTYKGLRVFSPHYDVEALVNLCVLGNDTKGARK